ncbi:MAG: DUF6077 domain-containing protein [Eubacteriales bacterium]|nr:DUF6077 domain-containing protein [Eubacteriales bacterium]
MNLMIKGLLAVFWLVIVPGAAGAPFLRKKDSYTFGESFLTGYLFLFSAAEILILPMMYFKLPLHILVMAYGGVAFLTALWGSVCLFRRRTNMVRQVKLGVTKASPWLWAAVVLAVLETCVVVMLAHMDADDSFYVGTATTAVQTDTIFSINAYTGLEYKKLPSRYVLSPFPVFLGVVSRLAGGLHPAVMAHMVYPAVFLPMAFLVLHQLGKKWFPEEKYAQGIFLFLTAVLTWFAGYSIYNAGNFQMVRIWQGKALLAAAFLPLLMYLSLSISMEKEPRYSWLLLALANLSCCLLSSMGVILAPLVTGIFIFLGLLKFRSLERTVKGALCCLPTLILGVVYLFIR